MSRVYETPAGEQTGVGRDGPLPSPFGEASRGTVLVDMVHATVLVWLAHPVCP